jgi:multiple sugar transport system ATP-binding protein
MKSGRLQQIGSPRDIFHRPNNTFVAGFIGSVPMNLLETTVTASAVTIGESTLPVPADSAADVTEGQRVIWGIRPEYLRWSSERREGAIAAEVVVTETLGATSLVLVAAGGHKMQVVVPEEQEPAPGDRGWVVPQLNRALLFDAESTERIG